MQRSKYAGGTIGCCASLAFGLVLALGTMGSTAFAEPDPSQITIDAPTPLRMDQDPSGTIVAHLTQTGGQPVSGARVELFIDGTAAASTLTNGDGTALLKFHRDLLPGDHEVDVRFNGNRNAQFSNALSQLSVLPIDNSRLTFDPLPNLQLGQDPSMTVVAHLLSAQGDPVTGARIELLVDAIPTGSAITDPSGTAQLTFRRTLAAGDHRIDLKFAGSRVAAPTSTTGQFSVGEVSDTRLVIDPLPTLQVGQDPSVTLVAHLASADNAPLSGARLDLLLDGVPAGSGVTDAQGTAQVFFRRDLAAGPHRVDLKFAGSRVAAGVVTSATLTVRPIAIHGLTIDPLPVLQVGQDPTVDMTAHLISDSGDPVSGGRLSVLVDGTPAGSGVTDANGSADLTFRRELAAGDHTVEVRFAGNRAAAPSSSTAPLSVTPIAVHGLTIDPVPPMQVGQNPGGTVVAHLVADSGESVPGARLSLLIDGTPAGSAVTDDHGTAQMTFRRELVAGDHALEVRFTGSRAAAPSSATSKLSVAPIAVNGLVVDPLPVLQVGQDPASTVVAHMTTDSGDPVAGSRLDLLIDGVPAGVGLTDASGTTAMNFRRDLLPGEHQVEVRFAGSRSAAPASVTRPLTVLEADVSSLTLDPLPTVRIGTDSVVTIVSHLVDGSAKPVPGARLELLVDDTQQRVGSTDATGSARLQFHPDLAPGDHHVEVRFGGTRGLSSTNATATLQVLPQELDVQVTPARAGARIAVNGEVFTSDDQGLVRLTMDKPGAYHVEALPWDSSDPATRLEFARWGDEVFTPARDIVMPQVSRLEVGFNTRFLVGLTYRDPDDQPVDLRRITSATISNSIGVTQSFRAGEQRWVDATRVVRRPGGLGEAPLEYSVDEVQLEGANVVNSKEQRFFATANLTFPVRLLLHTMRLDARAALAGTPIGSGVWLKYPDGHTDWLPFGQDAELELKLLPRGAYVAQAVGPGLTFAQPVALSRDQLVELKVVTYQELAGVVAALALAAVGLLVLGRRKWRVGTATPRSLALVAASGDAAVRDREDEA